MVLLESAPPSPTQLQISVRYFISTSNTPRRNSKDEILLQHPKVVFNLAIVIVHCGKHSVVFVQNFPSKSMLEIWVNPLEILTLVLMNSEGPQVPPKLHINATHVAEIAMEIGAFAVISAPQIVIALRWSYEGFVLHYGWNISAQSRDGGDSCEFVLVK